MGEAYVKTASVTVKHDPSVSASVLQTKLEPFVKTWWQTHSAGRCQGLMLVPWCGRVPSHFGQWVTAERCE